MAIEECIREKTHEIRYVLESIRGQVEDFTNRRKSEDDRLKRAQTEITSCRAVEADRKRAWREADEKVEEAQRLYDEVERQRREALDRLTGRKEEKDRVNNLVKNAQDDIERAQKEVRKVKDSLAQLAQDLEQKESERMEQEQRLRDSLLISLDSYLSDTEKRIAQAFESEQERMHRRTAADAFQRARHEDPAISELYEQLVQLREMLPMASVPGVKLRFERSIAEIREELERLYPHALTESADQETRLVEDVYYFSDHAGKVSFLFPIAAKLWDSINLGGRDHQAMRAMRMLWDFIGTDINWRNGSFATRRSWVAFDSLFAQDEVALLDGFRLEIGDTTFLEFRLAPLPGELKEALMT